MYAIVSIAGQQFKVEKNKKVFVHRLQEDEGSLMEFDKVLLIDNEGKIQVGNPYVKNALVTATIVSHIKGDKLLVFKKKRRKGYQKMNGHRQYLTEILIADILENATKKTALTPKKEKKEETEKAEAVAVTPETKEVTPKEKVKPKTKKVTAKKAGDSESKKEEPKKVKKTQPKAQAEKKPAAAKKKSSPKKDQ